MPEDFTSTTMKGCSKAHAAHHASEPGSRPATGVRPLVTFALFAYNQEKYIRDAVEGAFAQTYEPLEIIISDDCSVDRTYDIIEKCASEYCGSHRVRVNRNNKNLGVSRHVRHVHRMAHGEYVVHAGGDDISYPDRTAVIYRTFVDADKRPSVVMSCGRCIGAEGDVIDSNSAQCFRCGGASLALHRELIDTFTDPIEGMHTEDVLLIKRASLMHGVKYIDDRLLDYRILPKSLSLGGEFRTFSVEQIQKNNLAGCKSALCLSKQYLIDVRSIDPERYSASKDEMERQVVIAENVVETLSGSYFKSTFHLVRGMAYSNRSSLLKLYLTRWFPFLLLIMRSYKRLKVSWRRVA